MTMTMTKKKTKIDKKYDESGNLVQDTHGLSTVEYLILLVVIAVAGISIWTQVGESIEKKAGEADSSINDL